MKAAPKRKATDGYSDSNKKTTVAKKAKAKETATGKKGAEQLAEIEAVQLPHKLLIILWRNNTVLQYNNGNNVSSVYCFVPIIINYDNCDVVRNNIIVYLARKEYTQGALAKRFKCSVGSIRKFLAMEGPREGSGSIVYKVAYFFVVEKLRILEDKPQSAKHLRIEQTKPEGYELERGSEFYARNN
ncbi:hypothetical protein THRCLA_22620 [Thraustotheca clavata]|uniref:DUF7726 domain-containing protein n=1 Tax=Thraustotheca clavata TaxID=74557 RepID=A0A1V9YVN0_9STRA|nr:hypothetical protein THRCLA_22620 [Thraustotheca clavata]